MDTGRTCDLNFENRQLSGFSMESALRARNSRYEIPVALVSRLFVPSSEVENVTAYNDLPEEMPVCNRGIPFYVFAQDIENADNLSCYE